MSERAHFFKKEFLKTGPMPFLSNEKAILEVGQPIDFEILNAIRSGPTHFVAQNDVIVAGSTPFTSEFETSAVTSIPFDFTCPDCIEAQKINQNIVCKHINTYRPTINKKQ